MVYNPGSAPISVTLTLYDQAGSPISNTMAAGPLPGPASGDKCRGAGETANLSADAEG